MSRHQANAEDRELLRQEIARCWPRAREYWSGFLLLSDPLEDPRQTSIAQIDLLSRQVSLNPRHILYRQLTDCVEALLAHEIGHHVRYPGTFQTQARLRILE